MARKKHRKRPSAAGPAEFEEPHPSAEAGGKDAALFQLAARRRAAEQELETAMDELATAERRLSEASKKRRTIGRAARPPWLLAAVQKELVAGQALEVIYQQITRWRAHTKPGLAIKLSLLAELYGEAAGGPSDDSDIVSMLLSSLIEDVSER